MPLANFPNGFRGGLQLAGFPVLSLYATSAGPNNTSTAGVWFVDSATGLNGNKGDSWYQPLATIQGAFTKAKAGDIILVKQGHTETVSSATAAAWNLANVQIIGMGLGGQRPTITLDTANTSTITVSADAISVTNCVFVANFLNIAALFTLTTAKGFTLNQCEVRDTSGILNFLNVVTTSATSNANDGLLITGNSIFLSATSGVVNLLSALGTHDRVSIVGNYFASLTTNAGAAIPIAAGKILTNFLLLNNRFNLQNAAATATGYLITTNGSTNTGFIDGNIDHCLANTIYLNSLLVTAGSGFVFGQNWHSRTADKSPGVVLPAADS